MGEVDKPLRQLTSYQFLRTNNSLMAEFKQVFAAFGLRRTTFSVLALIVDTPGLRQRDLATALDIERPNLVQIIDELERAGLAERKTACNDRRAYALQPTDAGRCLIEKAMAATLARDAQITRGLSCDEIKILHRALKLIESNARALEDRESPEISRP